MNDTLKFVWAYMIENGRITTGEWSFYGGNWQSAPADWREQQGRYETFKAKVKKIGVYWPKTETPKSSTKFAFTDTFHDADQVETLIGTIVLNDGSEYLIGVSNAEHRFSNYAKLLSDLAEDKERVSSILGE